MQITFRIFYQISLPDFLIVIAIINPNQPYTVTTDKILSRCGWSPFEGHTYPHTITHTLVNGVVAYENGTINDNCRGQLLLFER